MEPFDFQFLIINWDKGTFEMSRIAVFQATQTLQKHLA